MSFGLADTAKLAVDLSLKGNFAHSIAANQRALKSFDTAVSQTGTRAFRAGQQIGTGILNAGKLIAVGSATVVGAVGAMIKVAGDFESQLNTINTIARATPDQLGAIGNSIRKVASDTGTSLSDLTQGYYDLLSAGVAVKDAASVLASANTLAIGGLSTTAESVDLLTTALNVYGGGAAAATKDADLFAKAIERGKVTAADLAGSFSQVGNIAKSSGIGLDELTAAYARLTAGGAQAGEASTQIRSAIVALTKVSPDLQALEDKFHRNYLAIAGKQGLVAALQQMRLDAAKAHVPLINLLGRVEGLNFALATTGPNFAAYNADLAAMGTATGAAAAQMAERQKGLNFQLAILKARLQDAAITIGSTLLPKITPLFERLNKGLADPKVLARIQDIGTAIAGLFSDANVNAGIGFLSQGFEIAKAAAPVIQQAASATLAIVKTAVDVFKTLPPWVQTLAVGAFAVNKLTGGLVTNVAGGIVGAILGQLKSAVVNVTGAIVNVGGAGLGAVGGVAGAGRGLLGTAAGLITKVTIVGIAAEAADLIHGAISPGGGLEGRTQTGQLLAGDQLSWPFGPKDTPHLDIGPFKDILGGDSQFIAAPVLAALTKAVPTADNRTPGSILDRGGREAGFSELAGKFKDDIIGLGGLVKGLGAQFHSDIRTLLFSSNTKQVANAVKDLGQIMIANGHGTVETTKATIHALQNQLKKTHDPQLEHAIRSTITDLKNKLPGREYAQRELAKADKIIGSNQTNGQKLRELQAIERDLKDHKLPGQTRTLAGKIDALKREQKIAQHSTTQAIKDKDLSVTVPVRINVPVNINARSVAKTLVQYTQYYRER